MMTGKAKSKKHATKEIAVKVVAATTNRGRGKVGLADCIGLDKGGHAKMEGPLCKVTAPDVKSMRIHRSARHPKIPFDELKLNNLNAATTIDGNSSKPRSGVCSFLRIIYSDPDLDDNEDDDNGKMKKLKHTLRLSYPNSASASSDEFGHDSRKKRRIADDLDTRSSMQKTGDMLYKV